MRKFFEGHSLTGVAIIFSVFFLGVLLRFYDLGSQSPWTDELASWWYSGHVDEVWKRESHSPLYYVLLNIFTGGTKDFNSLRLFSAVVSVIHLVECFFLGQLAFDKKKFLFFWILICLNPADIVYARMARHYAWLLEGILIYYLVWRIRAPLWVEALIGTFMGFIHVFAVIPISFLAFYRYWEDRKNKEIFIRLVTTNLIVFYYIGRILVLGHEAVRANVSWNTLDPITFWSSLLTQFLGSAYPRFEFFPVNPWMALMIVGMTTAFIAIRRQESGIIYLAIFLSSILIIESLSFWINLRTNRYLIFLIAFWSVAFTDSFKEMRFRYVILLLIGMMGYLLVNNPISNFPWEREKVIAWNEFKKKHSESQELVCSNVYQSDYYNLNAPPLCRDSVFNVDKKKPLLFFDLNGNDSIVAVMLMQEMLVTDFNKMKFGMMVKFVPKDSNGKSER